MKLILQRTNGAFGNVSEIPEGQWRKVSEHRKVKTAHAALEEIIAEMRRICGPGAWDQHYRLINAGEVAVRLTATIECYGSDHTREHHADCVGHVGVAWFWEPGQVEPPIPHQAGWHSNTCPACHTIDAEHEAKWRREYEEYEREQAGH